MSLRTVTGKKKEKKNSARLLAVYTKVHTTCVSQYIARVAAGLALLSIAHHTKYAIDRNDLEQTVVDSQGLSWHRPPSSFALPFVLPTPPRCASSFNGSPATEPIVLCDRNTGQSQCHNVVGGDDPRETVRVDPPVGTGPEVTDARRNARRNRCGVLSGIAHHACRHCPLREKIPEGCSDVLGLFGAVEQDDRNVAAGQVPCPDRKSVV